MLQHKGGTSPELVLVVHLCKNQLSDYVFFSVTANILIDVVHCGTKHQYWLPMHSFESLISYQPAYKTYVLQSTMQRKA